MNSADLELARALFLWCAAKRVYRARERDGDRDRDRATGRHREESDGPSWRSSVKLHPDEMDEVEADARVRSLFLELPELDRFVSGRASERARGRLR